MFSYFSNCRNGALQLCFSMLGAGWPKKMKKWLKKSTFADFVDLATGLMFDPHAYVFVYLEASIGPHSYFPEGFWCGFDVAWCFVLLEFCPFGSCDVWGHLGHKCMGHGALSLVVFQLSQYQWIIDSIWQVNDWICSARKKSTTLHIRFHDISKTFQKQFKSPS